MAREDYGSYPPGVTPKDLGELFGFIQKEANETMTKSNFTNDLLGYLIVLGHQPTINRLSLGEYANGKMALMGCYSRLMEALEKDLLNNNDIYQAIQKREHLNAVQNLPLDHPLLVEATEKLSITLYEFLRNGFVSDSVRNKYLNTLDAKLQEILKKGSFNVTPTTDN